MPNAIIVVTIFATENRAMSRARKIYCAVIHVTGSAVKFAHLSAHLALSSKCLTKTGHSGTVTF